MLKKLLCTLLLLALLTGAVSAAGQGQPPYAIRVNRAMNTVTIYTLDEAGQYTIPVKAMVCSTARPGHTTPLGEFRLEAYRSEWRLMFDGTYGQYATCFYGNFLFHSICYADDSHDAMVRESYNKLGEPASMGCVRLQTIDAKWIYDNCGAGTPVTVYDDYDSPGPLGKPEPIFDEITEEMYNGWDPSDPAPGNPWHTAPVTVLELSEQVLTLTAGEGAALEVTVEPQTAGLIWHSSDPAVATVDSAGKVTALAEGTAEIIVRSLSGISAACTVTVTGELLPFDDLIPGEWYYGELRLALEAGLFKGLGNRKFAPNNTMTRAMVVQALYNAKGRPAAPEEQRFIDVAEDAWYRDAVAWATEIGLVKGISGNRFAPEQQMTRQELATILWRRAGSPEEDVDFSAYADGGQIAEYALSPMAWLTNHGYLESQYGKLLPASPISRAEAAVLFQRTSSHK